MDSPEGIAIDHLGRTLFWTDSVKDRIEVASLDGSQRRVIVDTDLVNPRAIIADPNNGCVSSLGVSITVQSCVLFHFWGEKKHLYVPPAFSVLCFVDSSCNSNLYWADWNRDAPKIETSYMDGSNRRVLVKDELGLPNALTLDSQSSLLCWADAGAADRRPVTQQ